jgi:hypothetical protein
MAKPVYVAPTEDLSAAIFATLAPVELMSPTAGFHPLIVPSSVAKMKSEFAEACFSVIGLTPEMTKASTPAGVSGATIPVGVPCPPVADGTLTIDVVRAERLVEVTLRCVARPGRDHASNPSFASPVTSCSL